jgi:hypothetical protein
MNRGRPSPDSNKSRLAVEGADDFHVVCALVMKSEPTLVALDPRVPWTPKPNGDKQAIKTAVTELKNLAPRVGLVIDADTDPQKRWREVQRRFGKIGVRLPPEYPAGGYVEDVDDERRLGIWMMPYGDQPGALEAFLATLVPDGDLKDYVDQAVTRAREIGATFADKDLEKARLRTWLAWQQTPGVPYGLAIECGFLSSSSPWADDLVTWFRRLYLD